MCVCGKARLFAGIRTTSLTWVVTPAYRMPTGTPRPSWSLWARARDTPPVSFRGRNARGLA